jgi:hypothetical protein
MFTIRDLSVMYKRRATLVGLAYHQLKFLFLFGRAGVELRAF